MFILAPRGDAVIEASATLEVGAWLQAKEIKEKTKVILNMQDNHLTFHATLKIRLGSLCCAAANFIVFPFR